MKNLILALAVVFTLSIVSQQSIAQECSNNCGVVKNTMSQMANFVKSQPVRSFVKSQPVRRSLYRTKSFMHSRPALTFVKNSCIRVRSVRCKMLSRMRTNCCR